MQDNYTIDSQEMGTARIFYSESEAAQAGYVFLAPLPAFEGAETSAWLAFDEHTLLSFGERYDFDLGRLPPGTLNQVISLIQEAAKSKKFVWGREHLPALRRQIFRLVVSAAESFDSPFVEELVAREWFLPLLGSALYFEAELAIKHRFWHERRTACGMSKEILFFRERLKKEIQGRVHALSLPRRGAFPVPAISGKSAIFTRSREYRSPSRRSSSSSGGGGDSGDDSGGSDPEPPASFVVPFPCNILSQNTHHATVHGSQEGGRC